LLLESRSVGMRFDASKPGESAVTSGIVLRAPQSAVATWAQDVYLRTGSEDGSINNGLIYLDAAKGEQQIVMVASNLVNHVKTSVAFNFGEPGEATHVTYFGKSVATISGQLFVGGSVGIDGGVYAKGSFFSSTGHIFTANSGTFKGLVGSLEGEPLSETIDYIATGPDYIQAVFVTQALDSFTGTLTDRIYISGGLGNDDVITQVQGSLRVREDYGSVKFAVFEDRWQQLARLNQEPMLAWKENPVIVLGAETYPYPGREAFSAGAEALHQQDTSMFDARAGRSKPHGSGANVADEYRAPAFAAQVGVSLNTYTVLGESS